MPPLLTDARRDTLLMLDDGTITYARTATIEDYLLVEDLHARCSTGYLFALH